MTFPVVVDADRRIVEAYGIINVPTAVWIDEDDRIVRAPEITPGTDLWKDFTQTESGPHHDALRRWVREGHRPTGALGREQARPPTDAEQQARLHYRIGVHLMGEGDREGATAHFDEACRLAPFDWTIRRGTMPLRGDDPFGQAFFDFAAEWEAAGRPLYDD